MSGELWVVSSLKFFLCVTSASSAVNMSKDKMNRRGAEDAEITQRQITTPLR